MGKLQRLITSYVNQLFNEEVIFFGFIKGVYSKTNKCMQSLLVTWHIDIKSKYIIMFGNVLH